MMNGQNNPEKPTMTTIASRPANVVRTLSTIDGVYIQCRLPSGEDAQVPLRAVYALFEKELLNKVRMSQITERN
jgi:hypothetical protein